MGPKKREPSISLKSYFISENDSESCVFLLKKTLSESEEHKDRRVKQRTRAVSKCFAPIDGGDSPLVSPMIGDLTDNFLATFFRFYVDK